jgi:hypothetical protein
MVGLDLRSSPDPHTIILTKQGFRLFVTGEDEKKKIVVHYEIHLVLKRTISEDF